MMNILLADDSAAVRSVLRKIIEGEADMKVVGTASDGASAVSAFSNLNPDIVIMDVEMPVLDGLGALSGILKINPQARVIMCSSLTQSGGDVTMNALRLGAVDYILKPSAASLTSEPDEFSKALVKKIRNAARPVASRASAAPIVTQSHGDIKLNPLPPTFRKADILAIGSSTGGVQAIFSLLEGLGARASQVPIFITQHMPATFTRILAGHICQKIGLDAVEAEEGMIVKSGRVYIAPGGFHMEVRRVDDGLRIHLSDAEPENFCKPAVDPMLRSLLAAAPGKIALAILTGMGSDGLSGARMLVDQGHLLIAQDEQTSVVWGMPGAVAMAGICHAVLPIHKMGEYLAKYL